MTSVNAMIINIDRKNRSIKLSIKAKDNAETSDDDGAHASMRPHTGTTNLGALLKAKLDTTNQANAA